MIFDPKTTGCPLVSNTSAVSAPAASRLSLIATAVAFISGLFSGFAEMDGILISSNSSSRKRCLLSSMYYSEVMKGPADLVKARQHMGWIVPAGEAYFGNR